MRVVFVGPPGSGKGTQAALLRERLGLTYLGTGDVLREAVVTGTPLGKAAAPYMERGQLVPDTLVNDMVTELFRRHDHPQKFVLDGYPRNAAQARRVDALLKEIGLPLCAVVLFLIDDEVVVKRMMARQRADDSEETARRRVKLYRDSARELVEHYRSQNLIHEVNAADPIEQVYSSIAKRLSAKGN